MTDSASLKIERAEKHLTEMREILAKSRPFVLAIETDAQTRERTLLIKEDKAIVDHIALACGDIIHNLRSSLDHAYWEIVSANAKSLTDQQMRRIQFPFTSKAKELCKTIKDAYAQLAGTGFLSAMRLLKPHGQKGGNDLLYFVQTMDIRDKHRLLIPAVRNAGFSGEDLNRLIPDLPFDFMNAPIIFDRGTMLQWLTGDVSKIDMGAIMPPSLARYKRDLDVAIEIIFEVRATERPRPLIQTLYGCIDACREAVALMREGAASY